MLPMAFVMIAGPQILSSIFLATSEKWRQNSTAYVLGAGLATTATITIAYFVGSDASGSESSDNTIYVVILVLLLLAAAHTFHTRSTASRAERRPISSILAGLSDFCDAVPSAK